jgi:hypothetical protein
MEGQRIPKAKLRLSCSTKGCLAFVGVVLLAYMISMGFALVTLDWHYRQWIKSKMVNYSVTITNGTANGMSKHWNTFERQEIVKDGRVISKDGKVPLSTSDLLPTIDIMFDAARQCALIPELFMRCEVEYEPHFGYPIRLELWMIDQGTSTVIAALTPDFGGNP